MRFGKRAISFADYNPFQDGRIDPPSAEDLYRASPDLPHCIHDAIYRAKNLVGHTDLEKIKEQARYLDQEILRYGTVHENVLKQRKKTYVSADEADVLMSFLKHGDHTLEPSSWASLFGVLALMCAAEIADRLWPTPASATEHAETLDRLKSLNPSYETDEPHEFILECAVEAVRAVGFGEAIKQLKGPSRGGRTRSAAYLPIKRLVIEIWEDNYSSRTNSDAARYIAGQIAQIDPTNPPQELLKWAHHFRIDVSELKFPKLAPQKALKTRIASWIGEYKNGALTFD